MTVTVTTHLNFRGDARAALEFYAAVFDGELAILTYADAHSVTAPDEADQVMWGQTASADGFRIMAFDMPAARAWDPGTSPFFVALQSADAEELGARWARLLDGATVAVPLAPAAWAALYGMLTDRFGVTWVVSLEAAR